MTPTILKASDPADLVAQVKQSLEDKKDLYTPLFVSDEGLLCQRVVPAMCVYEYRLIVANDLDDLELQEQNLTVLDFDYMFNTVMWRGKYLQWMSRLNSAGLTVRDAMVKLSDLHMEIAERKDELRLVEDVRAGLRLAPMPDGSAAATIPFPVKYS